MAKKNIVSIEDRIPELKQARKKKANRRLIVYLSIFFFLILIIVYLQSPLSHIRAFQISGNHYLADDEIVRLSELTKDTSIWSMDSNRAETMIQDHPVVASAEIERNFPWTVDMAIEEHGIVGYINEETDYFPILDSGEILTESENTEYNGSAPLLVGFTEEEYLHKMANELKHLPQNIRDLISEIHWSPAEGNENRLLLYMNDGFIVDGMITNFAEDMTVYPSVAAQLGPEAEGVIHIGVGVYFESFNQEQEEEMSEEEQTNNEQT